MDPDAQEELSWNSMYSLGAMRNLVVHSIRGDEGWISGLQGQAVHRIQNPDDGPDIAKIRKPGDAVMANPVSYREPCRRHSAHLLILVNDPGGLAFAPGDDHSIQEPKRRLIKCS